VEKERDRGARKETEIGRRTDLAAFVYRTHFGNP